MYRRYFLIEDVEKMNMLECFGGAIDCRQDNQSMQINLDKNFGLIKTYQLILGNVYGKSGQWSYIDLKSFNHHDSKNTSVEFKDCDHHFSYMLPRNHTYMRIYGNYHSICLCDALSYNTSSSLRIIQIEYCQQLESLFCLSGSCSFCTNIHNLEILKLQHLTSLTVICKEVVDVGQTLSAGCIFSSLKEIDILDCNLIEKLLTPQLAQQLQNLETIIIMRCNSMKEIFAGSNNIDNDVGQPLSPGRIFSCLKEIFILHCNLIEKLMTPQLAQQLQNLETISIDRCDSMKEIFAVSNNIDDDSSVTKLPKLTSLMLSNLPKLKIVWKGIICCRAKPQLKIDSCPRLERQPTIEIEDV